MFFDGVKKFLGLDQNANALKKYSGLVDIVNSYADDIHSKSDDEIKSRFNELKLNLPDDLSEILPEVFAIVQ